MKILLLCLLGLAAPLRGQTLAEASAHLDAGRHDQAIAILKALADKEPQEVVYRFNLALAFSLAGQDAEAIESYRKTLELKSDLYEAWLNLGQLLVKTGQFSEAAPLLEKAVAQKPEKPTPVYLLGRAYLGLKRWPEAAAALEKAASLDPSLTSLPQELAAIREQEGVDLLKSGKPEDAIAKLESARKLSPTPAVIYALATAYLRTGRIEQSLAASEELVRLEPANAEVRIFRGRLLRDQKKYAEAGREFQAALKLDPKNADGWKEITGILILLQNYETALQTLEQAKQFTGETASYFYFRALMLDNLKQPEPALASYQKFLAMSENKYPDEEFKARQRVKVLERVVRK